jgi:hypothetical protein
MRTRFESFGRLHLVPQPITIAHRAPAPKIIEPLSQPSILRSVQIQQLIRRFDFVIAIVVALLCSYWILQGLW